MSFALEKRINRQIKAKEHLFSAVVPPCFEEIALLELQQIGVPNVTIAASGLLQWSGKLESFWLAHAVARIPVTFRWRITSFRATGFGEFQRKIEQLPWELYLPQPFSVSASVASQMSRLWHERAVEQRLEESLGKIGFKFSAEENKLLVHIEKNICTLWLSGDRHPLYHRGYQKKVAHAPLRDNIAFALLCEANFGSCRHLLDPMSGSGTFSLEALLAQQGRHPAVMKTFDWSCWPSFRPQAWNHLKKNLFERHPLSPECLDVECGDIDQQNSILIQENFEAANVNTAPPQCSNFFDHPPSTAQGDSLLVLNPPWGKRLQSEDRDLFRQIGEKISSDFHGWRWMVLIPGVENEMLFQESQLKWEKKRLFKSGGVPIAALIGKS